MSKRISILMAALAATAAIAVIPAATASAHSNTPHPQQWWFHGENGGGHNVCNNDAKDAVAGPFSSKADCDNYNPGGGGPIWAVTLGVAPNPVVGGGTITASGVLTKDNGSAGTNNQTVNIVEYFDAACTELMGNITSTTTGVTGSYSTDIGPVTTVPGDYYIDAESNGAHSACVDVVVTGQGSGGNGALTKDIVQPSNVWLIYSGAFNDNATFYPVANEIAMLSSTADHYDIGAAIKGITPTGHDAVSFGGYGIISTQDIPAGDHFTGMWLEEDGTVIMSFPGMIYPPGAMPNQLALLVAGPDGTGIHPIYGP